jgi:hypothetical protein
MEELVSIKTMNEFFSNRGKYFVEEVKGHTPIRDDDEGLQGEYNEYFRIYKHPDFPQGYFLKETYHTNSYGDDPALEELKFVTAKTKMIAVYE